MEEEDYRARRTYLTFFERCLAGAFGVLLVAVAIWAAFDPPSRVVALTACTPDAAVNCTVRVDGDITTFASAIAALGVAALLLALLGVRFSKVAAAGVSMESKFDDLAAGMKEISAAEAGGSDEAPGEGTSPERTVAEGNRDDVASSAFEILSSAELNRLRRKAYDANRGIFLAHLLGKPKDTGQAYRVAIFVVGHRRPITPETVEGATIFLGRGWGSRKFEAAWSNDGRLGVVVEAFGPFLALGEVRLCTGERVVTHHYIEFAQGELLR